MSDIFSAGVKPRPFFFKKYPFCSFVKRLEFVLSGYYDYRSKEFYFFQQHFHQSVGVRHATCQYDRIDLTVQYRAQLPDAFCYLIYKSFQDYRGFRIVFCYFEDFPYVARSQIGDQAPS